MTDHVIEVSRSAQPLDEEPEEQQVKDWLAAALGKLNQPSSEISIRIVDENEMAELNAQYRQKSGATNVLSFPSGLEADSTHFLGDIVVCSEVVLEESNQYGQAFPARYAHMLIHGLLHLLGHDHMIDAERQKMETLERELLAEFGMSNPYEVADAS